MDWGQWLHYLLFAYREVPQASTCFSLFELLYGRQLRGPIDLLKEYWESPTSTRERCGGICGQDEREVGRNVRTCL